MQSPFQINFKKSSTLFLKNLPSLKNSSAIAKILIQAFQKTRLIKNHRIQRGWKKEDRLRNSLPSLEIRNFSSTFISTRQRAALWTAKLTVWTFYRLSNKAYIYIDRISVKKSINSRNKERGKEVLNRKLEGCKAPLCWKKKREGKKERENALSRDRFSTDNVKAPYIFADTWQKL